MPASLYSFTALLQRIFPSCCHAVVCALALYGISPLALAQSPSQCETLLEAAEERYVSLAFPEADALVRDCLAQSDIQDSDAIRAYRLLALVFLRQDNLSEAKQAVVRLLSVSFEYAPDPVQDPPAYVALVTSIKEQLRVAERPVVQPDTSRAAPLDLGPEITAPGPELVRKPEPNPPQDADPVATQIPVREESNSTRWWLIGGGVVVAGVAAVLLTSGGSSSPTTPGTTPLPPPPAFPR